jgi:hypothetical protein
MISADKRRPFELIRRDVRIPSLTLLDLLTLLLL